MPEGDTIRRTAARLNARLAGHTVQRAWPATIGKITGRRLLTVEAAGKHLLMRFDGDLTLHSHMRMLGRWEVYGLAERWREPQYRARAVLHFDDVQAVCFNAPTIELVRNALAPVAHLGPDVLADTFDLDDVIARARRSDAATVGELLLEQRVCAGIGNIYKCEALWLGRLDPGAPVGALTDDQLRGLYRTARDLMRRSLAGDGFRPRHAVHARGGRACPRCGTPIAVRAQGKWARLTYWCPRCQTSGLTVL
jgi:endonuclease-8